MEESEVFMLPGGAWTAVEQRQLELAMRHTRAANCTVKQRWTHIANLVQSKTPAECLARAKTIAKALRRYALLPLLPHDSLLCVLKKLSGPDLCALACTCRALRAAAHDDLLWFKLCQSLPLSMHYEACDRNGEPVWKYCLRVRFALHGAWRMLLEHNAGRNPYLAEIGELVDGNFTPTHGVLPFRMKYGAIAELVQLQVKKDGQLTAATYREVANFITAHSANSRSYSAPIHMSVREVYKLCYPGYGSGVGASGVAPGVQAGGGSSSKASTGVLFSSKGKRVADEERRKRLDSVIEFFALVNH